MFYQWNRKIGWSATDPLINSNGGTEWDASRPEGDKWEAVNDPSPQGWRVPTFDELKALLDTNKVNNEWTIQNGVNGRIFTDKATETSIFLPAAGCRLGYLGSIVDIGTGGSYWSTTQKNEQKAYSLDFTNEVAFRYSGPLSDGLSIRPVAE
jgi:uncharacterized protein (TIGR02145 family)